MIIPNAVAPPGQSLMQDRILDTLRNGLAGRFSHQSVLVLIPDHTRSIPLPTLFRALADILADCSKLDFMVALGTHPPLSEESLNRLVGISAEDRAAQYKHIGLLNHAWDQASALSHIGSMQADEIRRIAGASWHPSLPERVEILINKAALEHDHIIILGPTFPHEVVGFSGGAKYLFPGISGPDMINTTHWLGALAGVVNTIGIKQTPVRDMIHAAAARLQTPVTLIALVVEAGELRGLFIGGVQEAWEHAADLSAQCHIQWCEKPWWRVLSCAPAMYDELWTAAKAMYKLEPAIHPGGELVIYAPHLDTVSKVHEKYIYEIGYHILPYFLNDWERFEHIPLGVLAHSTHLRGSGVMQAGIEKPNVRVTLASRISAEDCARLNLGYMDPDEIDLSAWRSREHESVLVVPHAGELLYRLRQA